MGIRKDHAEHNEKLSLQLYGEGVFFDWATTTAFYSALHYVNEKILPSHYNGKECSTILEAASALKTKTKHDATMAMVTIKLPVIADDYKFLMDSSFTARYYDYGVNKYFAKLCQKKLKKIREHCYPEISSGDES